jgi:hypothetical protein
MRRWVVVAALLLVVAVGIGAAIGYGYDGHHHDGVTRVVSPNGEETIVVRDERPFFFFPFGLFLFPLFFFLVFALLRGFFWRGRWGGPGGPGGPGGWGGAPPPWFEEWHRREHAGGPATGSAEGDQSPGGPAPS